MADHSTAQQGARLELKVNGVEVPVNDFVQSFIVGTLCGMLRSLHGVEDIQTVDLKFTTQ
jgi:hypothetical protein